MILRRILLSLLLCLALFLSFVLFVSSASSATPQSTNSISTPTKKALKIQTEPTTVAPTPTPLVIYPAPTPSAPVTTYTVLAGDTISSIALQYGQSWINLANYNKISDPNAIYPGQVLKIASNTKDYENLDPYYIGEITKVEGNTKHILVVLSEQKLYTYEGDKIIKEYLISSGVAAHPTVTGEFRIWLKLDSTTMSGGTGAEEYTLPNVLYTMYFFKDYGIHGTWWHNNFGTPMSHGCVNMSEADAEEVFNWAEVGTIVQVIP